MTVDFSDTAETVSPPLLGQGEPGPFTVVNPGGKAQCLLICDHAARRLPAKLGTLGLDPAELEKHSAVDIGALEATLMMAERLDAKAIIANYSRMVIDLNRRLDHPTMCPTTAEGVSVPGNIDLSKENFDKRVDEIYRPYHEAVADSVDSFIARGIVPALISIHSFSPVFFGQTRHWDVAVLWAQDGRLPQPFMAGMAERGYEVGDNEPYDARVLRGATMHMHADGRKLPNILIEYRNDHLAVDDRREKIVQESCDVLGPLLDDAALHTYYDGPETPHDMELEYKYFQDVVRTAHKDQ